LKIVHYSFRQLTPPAIFNIFDGQDENFDRLQHIPSLPGRNIAQDFLKKIFQAYKNLSISFSAFRRQ